MLHKVEHIKCSALYLELIESHGNILVPDVVGSYMCAERLYVKEAPVLALTFKYGLCFGVFLGKSVGIERSIGVLPYVVRIGYLFKTYGLIVEGAVGTGGIAAGVYKYLAFLLVRYLFEDIELVVEVVINNYDMVILSDLFIELVGIGYSLAG